MPGTKTADRVVVGIVAAVALAIAVSLGALIALVITQVGLSLDPQFGVVLSLTSSFVAFFAVIAVLAMRSVLKPRAELMSTTGWWVLSGALAFAGIVSALAFHWTAGLTWLAMALICLLKDPRVQSRLRRLGS